VMEREITSYLQMMVFLHDSHVEIFCFCLINIKTDWQSAVKVRIPM